MSLATVAENKCARCSHKWRDYSGLNAKAYTTGCPNCGSVYWKWVDYDEQA